METTYRCPLTDEMDKGVVFTHAMEYLLSHKKELNWIRWSREVDGPTVGHTEWSQKDNYPKYVESRKMVQVNLLPGHRDAVTENGRMDMSGGEGDR